MFSYYILSVFSIKENSTQKSNIKNQGKSREYQKGSLLRDSKATPPQDFSIYYSAIDGNYSSLNLNLLHFI